MGEEYDVYIMASRSGTLYVGITNDLAGRVHEHKHGLVPGFTSKYRVSRLVYCEQTNDVGAAIDREKQLKRWSKQKKMALVESVNPAWEDLQRGEGRQIAPGGARSLHFGRDDKNGGRDDRAQANTIRK